MLDGWRRPITAGHQLSRLLEPHTVLDGLINEYEHAA
jgi:hypothetical protein